MTGFDTLFFKKNQTNVFFLLLFDKFNKSEVNEGVMHE